MKASELIKRVQAEIDSRGDLDVEVKLAVTHYDRNTEHQTSAFDVYTESIGKNVIVIDGDYC